jgi:hypothetical protein
MSSDTSHRDDVDSLIQRAAQQGPAPRRRFPRWLILFIVLLLIGIAGVLYYLFRPLDAPIPAEAGAHYTGLEQGTTEQGFPRLGLADAPVVVEEFTSYACPHCRDFHLERFPDLLEEIAAGQVQFVVIPVTHIGAGAKSAAKGALCAGQQESFWTMQDVLFDWQDRFVLFTFDERRIRKGAENMGLDVEAFDRCMGGDEVESVLDTARSEFDRRGLSGTPSFFINGEKVRDNREFENLGQLAGELSRTP